MGFLSAPFSTVPTTVNPEQIFYDLDTANRSQHGMTISKEFDIQSGDVMQRINDAGHTDKGMYTRFKHAFLSDDVLALATDIYVHNLRGIKVGLTYTIIDNTSLLTESIVVQAIDETPTAAGFKVTLAAGLTNAYNIGVDEMNTELYVADGLFGKPVAVCDSGTPADAYTHNEYKQGPKLIGGHFLTDKVLGLKSGKTGVDILNKQIVSDLNLTRKTEVDTTIDFVVMV